MKTTRLKAIFLAILLLLPTVVAAELALEDMTADTLEALLAVATTEGHTGSLTLRAEGLLPGESAVVTVTAIPAATLLETAYTLVLTGDAPVTLTGLLADSAYAVTSAGWAWAYEAAWKGATGVIAKDATAQCTLILTLADRWLHDEGAQEVLP